MACYILLVTIYSNWRFWIEKVFSVSWIATCSFRKINFVSTLSCRDSLRSYWTLNFSSRNFRYHFDRKLRICYWLFLDMILLLKRFLAILNDKLLFIDNLLWLSFKYAFVRFHLIIFLLLLILGFYMHRLWEKAPWT